MTRWGMRIFGWIMVSIAIILISLIVLFYFYSIVPLVAVANNILYGFLVISGIFLSFNLLFNYIMCIRTPPGGPDQEWVITITKFTYMLLA
jgi:hypothetical protein